MKGVDLAAFFILAGVSIYGIFAIEAVTSKILFGCLLGIALTKQFVTHRVWRITLQILLTAILVGLIIYSSVNRG